MNGMGMRAELRDDAARRCGRRKTTAASVAIFFALAAPSSALAHYAPAPGDPSNNGSMQTAYGAMASGAVYRSVFRDTAQNDYYYFYDRPQDRVTVTVYDSSGDRVVTAVVLDDQGNVICGGYPPASDGSPLTCVPQDANTSADKSGRYYININAFTEGSPTAYGVSVSGLLFPYNPVSCQAAKTRRHRAKATEARDLRAARAAKRAHQRSKYRAELKAYRHQKALLAAARKAVIQRCSG